MGRDIGSVEHAERPVCWYEKPSVLGPTWTALTMPKDSGVEDMDKIYEAMLRRNCNEFGAGHLLIICWRFEGALNIQILESQRLSKDGLRTENKYLHRCQKYGIR